MLHQAVAAFVVLSTGQIVFDHRHSSQIIFDRMNGPTINGVDAKDAFAKALGEAIAKFLEYEGMQKADIAQDFGISKQLLDHYLKSPPAYMLFLACVRLGLRFDYEGFRISARRIKADAQQAAQNYGQYTLNFDRTFELSNKNGTLKVAVKRPPERLELLVSVDAKAS